MSADDSLASGSPFVYRFDAKGGGAVVVWASRLGFYFGFKEWV